MSSKTAESLTLLRVCTDIFANNLKVHFNNSNSTSGSENIKVPQKLSKNKHMPVTHWQCLKKSTLINLGKGEALLRRSSIGRNQKLFKIAHRSAWYTHNWVEAYNRGLSNQSTRRPHSGLERSLGCDHLLTTMKINLSWNYMNKITLPHILLHFRCSVQSSRGNDPCHSQQ